MWAEMIMIEDFFFFWFGHLEDLDLIWRVERASIYIYIFEKFYLLMNDLAND